MDVVSPTAVCRLAAPLRCWLLDGGLFRRVILHGGTALTSWSLSQDPLASTRLLAELVNCSAPSSTSPVGGEVLRCLKRLPVEHVVEKARLVSAPRFAFQHARRSRLPLAELLLFILRNCDSYVYLQPMSLFKNTSGRVSPRSTLLSSKLLRRVNAAEI